MSRYEITHAHIAVMGSNPSSDATCGDECPVENVTVIQAVTDEQTELLMGLPSCYTVNGTTITWNGGFACAGFRLPTESEWEIACRAGESTAFSGSADSYRVGWHAGNSGGRKQPVGRKAANAWGLHDMSGNVAEWTWDRLGAYPNVTVVDPIRNSGPYTVNRGGFFGRDDRLLRCGYRTSNAHTNRYTTVGFRIVRSDVAPES